MAAHCKQTSSAGSDNTIRGRQPSPNNVNAQHKSLPQEESALAIGKRLLQHPLFPQYRDQVYVCMEADDQVFHHLYCLREDPRADLLIRTLQLPLHLVIPDELWNLLVQLRSHHGWKTFRNVLLAKAGNEHLTSSPLLADSQRSSVSSNKSHPRSSVGTALSSRTSTSSVNPTFNKSTIDSVEECQDDETGNSPRSSNHPTSRSSSLHTKGSRKAPKGYAFFCPGKDGRRKCTKTFKRIGDYMNHLDDRHPEIEPHEPRSRLRPQPEPVEQPTDTVVKDEAAQATTPASSMVPPVPGLPRPEVSRGNDFPPSGPEYHLPPDQLNHGFNYASPNYQQMHYPPDYLGNTGVQMMYPPEAYGQYYAEPLPLPSNHSFFHHHDSDFDMNET